MSGKKIVIVDYDMGNKHSIKNAIEFLGYKTVVSRKTDDILNGDALILPGVGSFKDAMANINRFGLKDIIKEVVINKQKPIFGICLGMQILAKTGYEGGECEGLGVVNGIVKPLDVLHVGFNSIEILKKDPLFYRIMDDTHFYFDHSYFMDIYDIYITSRTLYNGRLITASIEYKNIFATQFHPEKSQKWGLVLLRNFLNFVEKKSG